MNRKYYFGCRRGWGVTAAVFSLVVGARPRGCQSKVRIGFRGGGGHFCRCNLRCKRCCPMVGGGGRQPEGKGGSLTSDFPSNEAASLSSFSIFKQPQCQFASNNQKNEPLRRRDHAETQRILRSRFAQIPALHAIQPFRPVVFYTRTNSLSKFEYSNQ